MDESKLGVEVFSKLDSGECRCDEDGEDDGEHWGEEDNYEDDVISWVIQMTNILIVVV